MPRKRGSEKRPRDVRERDSENRKGLTSNTNVNCLTVKREKDCKIRKRQRKNDGRRRRKLKKF